MVPVLSGAGNTQPISLVALILHGKTRRRENALMQDDPEIARSFQAVGRVMRRQPPDGLLELNCHDCNTTLDLIQPDPTAPDRMLGVCPGCHGWYLVELDPEQKTVVVLRLPGPNGR
jgi:hypothetical protein